MQKTLKEDKSKGITLIALIITIIIMLILAGVAMSMISAEGGLFEKTKYASDKYNNSVLNEAETIDDLMATLINTETIIYNISPLTSTREASLSFNTTKGYTVRYKIGEDDWKDYSSPVPINKNGYIYARLKDSEGRLGNTQTITIGNIDRIQPGPFELSTEATSSSIIVRVNEDEIVDKASEGAFDGIAGIKGYQYQIDGGEWTEVTESTYKVFNNLTSGTKHTVGVQAIDFAGNPTEASNNGETVEVLVVPRKISDMIEDGSIKVGYYIGYDVGNGKGTNNGQYTITKEQSGYTSNQTYNVKSYTGKWRVYRILSNTIEIISENNVLTGNSSPWLYAKVHYTTFYPTSVAKLATEHYINPELANFSRVPMSNVNTGAINYTGSTVELTAEQALGNLTDYNVLKNNKMLTSNYRYWTHRNHKQATQFGSANQFFYIYGDGSIGCTTGRNYLLNYACGLRPIIRLLPDAELCVYK